MHTPCNCVFYGIWLFTQMYLDVLRVDSVRDGKKAAATAAVAEQFFSSAHLFEANVNYF